MIDLNGIVETHTSVPVSDTVADFAEKSDLIPTVPTCLRQEDSVLNQSGLQELT